MFYLNYGTVFVITEVDLKTLAKITTSLLLGLITPLFPKQLVDLLVSYRRVVGCKYVDVLVITPFPLLAGVVVRCRPIGVLKMQDESGGDAKVLAVPVDKVLPIHTHWQKPEDMNILRLQQIQHFFEHYKDLEPSKWVKVEGWFGPDDARAEILGGVENYKKAASKPNF